MKSPKELLYTDKWAINREDISTMSIFVSNNITSAYTNDKWDHYRKIRYFFCEIVDTQFISSWNKLKLAI